MCLYFLKSTFNKGVQGYGYKINVQNSIVLFHTSNKPLDIDINKTVPLIIASKRIKCLGIHLPK